MSGNKQKLELTWIGKEDRPRLEPRILIEDAERRRSLFDAQDEIDGQRERLIGEIEGKLRQGSTLKPLFNVRWNLE
jgi:hypothetical protein